MIQPDIPRNAKPDVARTYKAVQQCGSASRKGTTASTPQGSATNSRCSTGFLLLQSFRSSGGKNYKLRAVFI